MSNLFKKMPKTVKAVLSILLFAAMSFFAVFIFFTNIAVAVVIEFVIIALLSLFALGVVGIALYFGHCYSKYKCLTCGNSFFPSPKNFLFSLWLPKKRFMKCPVCGKRHWCEKEIFEVKKPIYDVEYTIIND